PDNANLYPGQDTTGVVPLDTFHREPLYIPGFEPSAAEILERIASYWKPYHAKLGETLALLKSEHGCALLWDAHSILSVLPRFFAGRLPDFNLGTADGKSCAPGIGEKLAKIPKGYSVVLNGRFKGGYITRAYGDPLRNVHAVQLELSEAIYMEEQLPYRFRQPKAAKVRPQLKELLKTFTQGFAPKA
ncbi:MAG TPA: N-formylglutamate amidohydrolase, partial [Burkholderiales bacterium]|nr:N-formylglutamate amidohydrolase [Burkholderiales bacterium]